MLRHFRELTEEQWAQGKFLCIGLDTDFEKLPESLRQHGVHDALVRFNKALIDATKAVAGSYKFNSAFYEEHGDEGMAALRESVVYLREEAPDAPVILDAKRADIGNTNAGYVRAIFDHYEFDAVTVHPYLGAEALAPFLERAEKGIIVLCRTSNPGAGEFQDLDVGEPLYLRVARRVSEGWNTHGNCALVVGATYPDEMRKIRAITELPFLIPGIGAQGGDLVATIAAGKNAAGTGMIIASSRAILYASPHEDFADAARTVAEKLDSEIKKALL